MIDDKQFGALAAQLLDAAQVPGSALDMAMAFRRTAQSLAEGRLVLSEAPSEEPVGDDG